MDLTGRQWAVLITMDLLLLIELGLAMYLGSRFGDLTSTFLSIFLPAAVVTVFACRKIIKSMARATVSASRRR